MFAAFRQPRKAAARLAALVTLLWVAACAPISTVTGGAQGPSIDPSAPVPVAMLLPGGSGVASDDFLAETLENSARMAISDLGGVQIDLRVYQTGSDPAAAANAATEAVNNGAQIILGPLYAESANAAGVATAGSGVNILAFSNNPTIAGGNVFILGQTFRDTADRLIRYGTRNGLARYFVVHGDDAQGQVGRQAIASAAQANGAQVVGAQSYPLSQQGILSAAPGIVSAVESSGAQAVFMTAGVNADLPILATALPDQGLSPEDVQYVGLTRWNATPQALSLPGLQGGLFALPDRARTSAFESRYQAAYGEAPHPLAGLAYDGIAAIGALVSQGRSDALTRAALTQSQGFQGTSGIFRLLPNGTNERGLAVAEIRNNQVVVLDPAPSSFGAAGF